jgi:rhodanese-related sulfurtransferase|tara:strand:+ start:983 stop:1318 length:336 start_codon:yes stop_codon:yes gene_type:complete
MDLYNSTEITVHQLNELRQDDINKIQIIDVREDTERDHASIKGTIHMKLSEIAKRHTELDKDKNIFVMCHTGTRSQAVCKWLKAQGYQHCVNVLGGIDAWAALIDRNIRRY